MQVLHLDKVHAAPWGHPLLQDICLELSAGEILGIIGPNGAGKSSLLQVLVGDMTPTSGTVTLLGEKVSDWKPRPKAQRVAVLPQISLLNFPYSVEEVILLGRTPHSSGSALDREILSQVMLATDTSSLARRVYTQLSGGEKQRVQLARVFAQVWPEQTSQPRLLLLDEPTTALDLAHQQLIMQTVRELANSGCAVAVVAHDFQLLSAVATRITALSNGAQMAHGSPGEVLTAEVFSRVFDVAVNVTKHPKTGQPVVIAL
jgi:iron complex transport system ATP-binding protein